MRRVTLLALLALALPTAALANTLNLFVTVSTNSGVVVGKYTTSGATVNPALITGLRLPEGIAVSGSDLFVANDNQGLHTGYIGI